ncbi:hypothetical protein ACSBR1_033728 [Camellia fascicularis]
MLTSGWIPVVRGRGRAGPWRSRDSAGVFTVFVDNLPASMNPKDLFNLFIKFGVVKDVFIPQKRRRVTNTRFGFVRFDCFVAAKIAVQKANGLWMDDRSLQVKLVEFGKEKGVIDGVRIPLNNQVRRPVANAVQGGGFTARDRGFRDKRSYVEAVEGKMQRETGSIFLKAEEKELAAIGMEDIMVRDSGGRVVVITFKSKEERALKISAIKELVSDWCEDIAEGKPGQVLCLEEDMSQPITFVRAKIKVSTTCMDPINSVVNLECRGMVFPVRVCEEQVVIVRTPKVICRGHKIQDEDELVSSNVLGEQSKGRDCRNEEDDGDELEDDSAADLEVGYGVDQENRTSGCSGSMEVEDVAYRRRPEEAKNIRSDGSYEEMMEVRTRGSARRRRWLSIRVWKFKCIRQVPLEALKGQVFKGLG